MRDDASNCEFEKYNYPIQFLEFEHTLFISGQPNSKISLFCDVDLKVSHKTIHRNPMMSLPGTGIGILPTVCRKANEYFSYTPTRRKLLMASFFPDYIPFRSSIIC